MDRKKGIVILYRDVCSEWLDLLCKEGIDTLGLHFIPDRFEMDGYLDWLSREGGEWIKQAEENGLCVEHELHALRYLLPRALFEEHPEYFRVNAEGERTAKHNACVSSEEGMAIVEERACALAFALKQKGHRYYWWSDDVSDAWCHCERCRSLTSSDQNLLFLSHVLNGLRRYDPQAELCYLAYHDTITPPHLPIPEGIFLEFAPIKRDLSKPLTDEVNRPTREAIESLLRVFDPSRAEILEYWLDVSLYCKWGKLPIERVPNRPEVWQADFAYYTSLGISKIKTFGAFVDRDYFDRFGNQEIVSYAKILNQYL